MKRISQFAFRPSRFALRVCFNIPKSQGPRAKSQERNKPGFIALVTVLIVMALGVLLAAGLSLRSVDAGNIYIINLDGTRAHVAATHCAEYALSSLKAGSSYPGNETRILDNGDTCYIATPGGGGDSNRTVRTTSTVNGANRKIDIYIDTIGPYMEISKWQEVADF
ncbi:MAG: hypothetical protein ABII13_04240 [Patescibacteria group bacterium]|nr:hypothetical protein [Patescibacteria group bacterium]